MVRSETDPKYAEYLDSKLDAIKKVKNARIEEQRKIEKEQNDKIAAKQNEYNAIKTDVLKKEDELKGYYNRLDKLEVLEYEGKLDANTKEEKILILGTIRELDNSITRLNENIKTVNTELEKIIEDANKQRQAAGQTVEVLPEFLDPAFIVESENFKIFNSKLSDDYPFQEPIEQFLLKIKNTAILINSNGTPKFKTNVLNFTRFNDWRYEMLEAFKEKKQMMFVPDYLKGWDMTFDVGPQWVEVKYDFKKLEKNALLPILSAKITEIENDKNCPKYLRDYIPPSKAEKILNDELTSRTSSYS